MEYFRRYIQLVQMMYEEHGQGDNLRMFAEHIKDWNIILIQSVLSVKQLLQDILSNENIREQEPDSDEDLFTSEGLSFQEPEWRWWMEVVDA